MPANTVSRTAMAATALLLAASALTGCSDGPKHTIVFEVLEDDLSGAQTALPVQDITYSWSTGGSQGPTDGARLDHGTPLPWSHTVTTHGDLFQMTLEVELDEPTGTDPSLVPVVQCRITVDGTEIVVHNDTGSIDCEADQDEIRRKLG